MSLSTKSFRATILALAAISGMIAIVVAAGIVPAVLKDTSPGANPEGAAIAFCINAGLFLVMAVTLIFIAHRSSDSSSRRPGVLSGFAALSLLLALALLDAFDSFRISGQVLATARRLMLFCGALGFLFGILLITSAIVFRKGRTTAA
jgi:hypothetical protein